MERAEYQAGFPARFFNEDLKKFGLLLAPIMTLGLATPLT